MIFAIFTLKSTMKNLLYLLLLSSLFACTSTQKNAMSEAQAARVQELISTKNLLIHATWAYPQADNVLNQLAANNGLGTGNTAGRISLLDNNNTFRLKNDTARAYLPFFGERRLSGGYNSSNAVDFDGRVVDFKSEINTKKKRTELSFDIQETGETYEVYIEIYHSGRASISVNSAHRSYIRYDGVLVLDEEKEQ